jgi:hypothetical protein
VQNDDLKELDACPICGKRPEWIDWYPISGYSRLRLWALRCPKDPHCIQTSYEEDLDLTRHNWRRICNKYECSIKNGGSFLTSSIVVMAAIAACALLALSLLKPLNPLSP